MACSAHETRAKNVPVTVSSGDQRKDFVVDQTVSLPEGKHARPIGTVELVADTETIIQIASSNTVGFVILYALQLLPIKRESKLGAWVLRRPQRMLRSFSQEIVTVGCTRGIDNRAETEGTPLQAG